MKGASRAAENNQSATERSNLLVGSALTSAAPIMNIVQAKADVHSALHDSIHARSVLLCRYVTLNLNQRQASVSFP